MIHGVLKTLDIRTRGSVLKETPDAGSCLLVCMSSPGSWSQENAGAASGPTTVRISGGQTTPTHTHTHTSEKNVPSCTSKVQQTQQDSCLSLHAA